MRLFNEHFATPIPFREVFLPSVKETFEISENLKISLYLLIDKRNRVEDISYKFEGDFNQKKHAEFSFFCEYILGHDAREVLSLEWHILLQENEDESRRFLFLPAVLYRQLLKKLYYSDAQVLSWKEGELLCRCFGVTQTEIKNKLVHGEITSLREATDLTMAAAGCGSCAHDVEELISDFCNDLGWHFAHPENPRLAKDGSYPYIKNQPPVYWILALDEILKDLGVDGEIVDLIGHDLHVKVNGPVAVGEIEKAIKERTSVVFHLITLS